jgi:shikimate kinase
MRGVGRATGAITFVNALATGIGSAAAVTLPVEAEVELVPIRATRSARIALDPECDTPLARATLLAALQRLSRDEELDARLHIRSRVPVARGLKSSSAVSDAILRAVSNALHRPLSSVEIARISADVAQESGLSATGAFDDALAAVHGGIVVTENHSREVLRVAAPDPALQVVLWVPRSRHLPSSRWAAEFRARSGEGRAAVDAALRGRYDAAMERNTELVERVVGYEYRPLREELRRRGARASGVSGMGPTLAVLVEGARMGAVTQALPRDNADVLRVDFQPVEHRPAVREELA